tara:strand:- start:3090 stop:3224 length:135 start_codon:yes stop_codon:yes gene_type:complete
MSLPNLTAQGGRMALVQQLKLEPSFNASGLSKMKLGAQVSKLPD